MCADVLAEETDQTMVEFAMGGVCNCCLDEQNKAYFIANDAIEFTIKCLSRCVYTYAAFDRFLFGCCCVCVCVCVCVRACVRFCETLFSYSPNEEAVLSAITTLMFLATPETKKGTYIY